MKFCGPYSILNTEPVPAQPKLILVKVSPEGVTEVGLAQLTDLQETNTQLVHYLTTLNPINIPINIYFKLLFLA